MKSGCGRRQDASSMAEELATAILAECSKCGRGAGNRILFWLSAPSLIEKLAETARLFAGSAPIVASMCTSGTTVPLWKKMLFQWHFQVYVLYTFDITNQFIFLCHLNLKYKVCTLNITCFIGNIAL